MTTGNQINNTPIVNKIYNSRALITHKTVNKNCYIRPDGELWCLLVQRGQVAPIFRSTDNGFSWNEFEDDTSSVTGMNNVDGLNDNGPHMAMMISELYDSVRVIFPDWPGSGTDWDLESCFYSIADLVTNGSSATRSTATIASTVFQGNFNIAPSINENYVGYIDANQLSIRRASPRFYLSISAAATCSTTSLATYLGMCADEDGHVDCLIQHITGGESIVKHVRYTESSNDYGTVHTLLDIGASDTYDAVSMDIARDSYGTLCAVWSAINYASNNACIIYYATSTDAGATWDVNALTPTSGHSYYTDSATSEVDGRTTVIGGSKGGFLFSYVEDSSTSVPRTYIRRITTTDGSTYTLGDEKEIGTSNTLPGDAIVGLHFFQPIDTQLIDISDPGLVRIAYQVGEGNDQVQSDTFPVSIKQELLSLSAYPSLLASETEVFSIDTADASSILVLFSVLTGPSDAVDFYTLGKTGSYTTKYINAFSKLGTTIRLLKFIPDESTFMNDRSAYGSPTESSSLCIFQPQSYAFPVPSLNVNEQTEFVEQDVRKIFLPPTTFLDRVFLVNQGGYLKRTVWLCQFDGNLYEISQIVPYFLNNQICYYEANAYVVGPSRDPFSRTILPSET